MRIVIALVMAFSSGPVWAGTPDPARIQVASSALGDLSSFRTITADTLAIVRKGDIPAARARVKDLEASWDKAEATLKPKDTATWTMLDKKIDDALTDLRTPNPRAVACEASLRALLAAFDKVEKT